MGVGKQNDGVVDLNFLCLCGLLCCWPAVLCCSFGMEEMFKSSQDKSYQERYPRPPQPSLPGVAEMRAGVTQVPPKKKKGKKKKKAPPA
jgi:hypothetical protein